MIAGWTGALATVPRDSRAHRLRLRLHGLEQHYLSALTAYWAEQRAFYPTEPAGSALRVLLACAARRYRLALYVAGFPQLARRIPCPPT